VRCSWARNALAIEYHDREWGVPQHDDHVLFEFLVLEGAQAGLSWDTILRKRENYRSALDGFDPQKIARYSKRKLDVLMRNDGIVRNRLKVASVVKNAQAVLELQKEFGSLDRFVAVCGRQAPSKCPPRATRGTGKNSGIRCDEQSPAGARAHLRGINNLLRLYASSWDGERSSRDMFSLSPNAVARS